VTADDLTRLVATELGRHMPDCYCDDDTLDLNKVATVCVAATLQGVSDAFSRLPIGDAT
jgi:hypothetical protein